MSNTAAVKRHPIRGLLYGIVFGLGLALVAVGQGLAALGTWPPFLLLLIGIVVGVVWSMFGPAKGPRATPTPTDPSTILFGDSDQLPATDD